MQTKTKHRIIGGIVLLAIVAIFLPLLFHNSRPSMDLKLSTQVPSAPAKPQVQLQLPALDNAKGSGEKSHHKKPQSMKAAAQETPAITQHILNTAPAPAIAPKAAEEITQSHSKKAAPKPVKKSLPKSSSQSASKAKVVKPASVKSKPAKPHKTSQKLLQSSVPQAWTIQIASFTKPDNAKRLVKRLRDKGFDVYTRQNQSGRRTITRVFVGPIINQAKVKKMKRQLKQQFQLKGVIRRYSI